MVWFVLITVMLFCLCSGSSSFEGLLKKLGKPVGKARPLGKARAVGKVEGKPSPLQEETFLAGWGVTEASCKLPAGSGAGIGLAVTVGRTT